MTPEQKVNLATKAIQSTLKRIRADERIRHLIGVGSQTFDELTAAYSELTGVDLVKVRENFITGSGDFPHSTALEILNGE